MSETRRSRRILKSVYFGERPMNEEDMFIELCAEILADFVLNPTNPI